MASPLDIFNASSFPTADTVVLGGRPIPGRATPAKGGAPFKWDERPGFGLAGASLVPIGGGLSAFEIIVQLWTEEQFGEWETFANQVLGKPKPPYGLSIVHPLVNRAPLNIKSVVVEDVSQFEDDDYGLFTCTISVRAYRAPAPLLVKPAGPTPPVAVTPPTAADAADTMIANQLAEVKSLL